MKSKDQDTFNAMRFLNACLLEDLRFMDDRYKELQNALEMILMPNNAVLTRYAENFIRGVLQRSQEVNNEYPEKAST
jgi:hypothetical protein